MSGASSVSVGVLVILIAVALDLGHVGRRSWGDTAAAVLMTLGTFSVMLGSGASRDLQEWLVGTTASGLEAATVQASVTDARFVASGLVSLLFLIEVLAIIPAGAGGRFKDIAGRFSFEPRKGWRINWKVCAIGIPLGMLAPMADLPGSVVAIANWLWTTVWAFGAALGGGA